MKKIKSKSTLIPLNGSGIKAKCYKDGIWQWRLESDIQPRIRRFISFIAETSAQSGEALGLYAARLVAMDGIHPSSLASIGSQLAAPYKAFDGFYLEWKEQVPPRTERRSISRLTMAARPHERQGDEVVGTTIEESLSGSLKEFLGAAKTYQDVPDAFSELALDALCWWYQCVPAPMFAHLAGLQHLSALPRSALARKINKQAVVHESTADAEALDTNSDLGYTAELVYTVLTTEAEDISDVLITEIEKSLQLEIGETDGLAKRRWAKSIGDAKAKAERNGAGTSLVLAWLLHLCEHGTRIEPNLACSTIKKYFSHAAIPLWKTLKTLQASDKGPESWDIDELQQQYKTLKDKTSPWAQKTMASSLASFHYFLQEWFELPALSVRLHDDIPLAEVSAQAVWDFEIALVLQWLDQVEDERLQTAGKIILLIAWEAPARTNELMRLRLSNIRHGVDMRGIPCMEIEIARMAKLGRLKSSSAQRRLTIHDPNTIDLIKRWSHQRAAEGSASDGLLFGEPTSPHKLYRPGSVTSLLNQMLKMATGEKDVRIHTLRHSAISRMMEDCLQSSAPLDLNRYAAIAAHSGHASAATSFRSYFHTYEAPLRQGLDFGMMNCVPLTADKVVHHLHITPSALRQRRSRSGIPESQFLWQQLQLLPCDAVLPSISDTFKWQSVDTSSPRPKLKNELTVATALQWLLAWEKGVSTGTIALIYGCSEQRLSLVAEQLLEFGKSFLTKTRPRLGRDKARAIHNFKDILEQADVDLRTAKESKFHELSQWLEQTQRPDDLLKFQEAWLSSLKGTHIALAEKTKSIRLLNCLKEAGVPGEFLRIGIEKSATNIGLPNRAGQTATDAFRTAYGMNPRSTTVEKCSGRPAAYLQWDAPAHVQKPRGRTASISGLNVWMLAVTTYLIYMECVA